MKRVFVLVNSLADFNFGHLLEKHLPGTSVTIGESMPSHPSDFSLVIPWSYRRIIKGASAAGNVVVFHSSDLPEGRGWAPIYNVIARQMPTYVVTGIIASDGVDEGDVVVKASFAMRPEYTAPLLRAWDTDICLMLAGRILARMSTGWALKGTPQSGPATWYARRRATDGVVSLDSRLGEVVHHLRASEPSHPAHFYLDGVRYDIEVRLAQSPPAQPDVKVEFFG